eukprot:gene7281-7494_t
MHDADSYVACNNVCAVFTHQALCTDLAYEDFHGYSVELWEAVAAAQGLEEGLDWSFTCFDTEEALLEDLEDPDGNCTMSATGVELNVETTMSGSLKFSWPFYKSGFSVMVSNRPHKADKWLFGEAFHWSVWILLVLTTVLMGVLVTFAEMAAIQLDGSHLVIVIETSFGPRMTYLASTLDRTTECLHGPQQ